MVKMLEVENLEVAYGGIKALQGISFHVEEGEVVTLIGANGAGKSSTLRAISGMVKAAAGRTIYKNADITNLPSHQIARLGIAHVPEGRGIFAKLSVEENLTVATYVRKDDEGIKNDLKQVYEMFPRLEERKKQAGGSLSGGEQQMLAIGRALMTGSNTLLLDEPSMGLAPLIVKDIYKNLKEINKLGKTILLVEQNAMMALRLANRAYILETGRIILSGKADQLINDPDVKRAYMGGH
jgi:branched-chain amino acid transport system ATP-binding protein